MIPLLVLAQTIQVSVVHQPVEAFTAAFGSKVRGVGLYSVRACVLEGRAAITGSRLLQVAEKAGVSPVDNALVEQLARKAARGSTLYKITRLIEWAAFIAGFVTASGAVVAKDSVRVMFPILGLAADRVSSELGRREYGSAAGEMLNPHRTYDLALGACGGGMFVGAYRGAFSPVVVEISR